MLSLCFSIEQLFKEMASSEPVLKIAVSRGGQTLDLVETRDSHLEDWEEEPGHPEADRHGSAAASEEGESAIVIAQQHSFTLFLQLLPPLLCHHQLLLALCLQQSLTLVTSE